MATERCWRACVPRLGRQMPIFATLDLHANVGPEMLENATALIPFDTYPHIDNAERGDEAMRLAAQDGGR